MLHPLSHIKVTKNFSYDLTFNSNKRWSACNKSQFSINKSTALYFDSFGIEHIKKTKKINKMKNKSINHNTFKIQSDDSVTHNIFKIHSDSSNFIFTNLKFIAAGKS